MRPSAGVCRRVAVNVAVTLPLGGMPEDRSSSTDPPSARRVGTGARRMPASRKFEYQKLRCPGRVLPCRELLTSVPSENFGWRSRLEQRGPVHSRSGPSSCPYSPKCVEQEFSELRLYRILGSSHSPGPEKLAQAPDEGAPAKCEQML